MSCSTDKTKDDMGIFDRLKKEKIEKTHLLMDEDRFWTLIDKSKKSSDDLEEFTEDLTNELKKLSSADIIGFHLREQKLRFDSYTSELWCAGYIMNGGCSDDSFEYFRCWIIAQGKEAYYSSLKNSDWLVNLYSEDVDEYDFEDLMYIASDAFEQKNKKDIEDYVDYNRFKEHEGEHPEIQFNWEEDNEESMMKICPKLMEAAGN
jgi:hypothetical protein